MIAPNKNPLFPASLAANGIQGADANARGVGDAKHSPQERAALFLAVVAMDAARGQLDTLATMTADPAPGVVEAADLLDAARAVLAGEAAL